MGCIAADRPKMISSGGKLLALGAKPALATPNPAILSRSATCPGIATL
jgi:hypothetical protein